MRILVINPNTSAAMTNSIHASALQYAGHMTQIETISVSSGPVSIENFYDQAASVIGLIETIRGSERSYDAIVIAAACDPGIAPVRELVEIPVIGIGEAAMHLASLVANKFSIITVFPRIVPLIQRAVEQSGLQGKCNSIRSIESCVLDTEGKSTVVEKQLYEASIQAIEYDKAEAICLGCSGMTKFAEDLEKKINIPVFDGVVSAIKLAEALVEMHKKTSKLMTYQSPSHKEYSGIVKIVEP
jgi:allantoin racemase